MSTINGVPDQALVEVSYQKPGSHAVSNQDIGPSSTVLPWAIVDVARVEKAHELYLRVHYRNHWTCVQRGFRTAAWYSREHLEAAIRRTRDILIALLALILLSPLLLLIALLIRIDSPGPILFKQSRVGKEGQLFTMYKFRSMVIEAELIKEQLTSLNEAEKVHFKIRTDPRMTRVGRFIRKTSIDELPQLINVLRGEMSTVGPRPSIPSEVAMTRFDHLRRLEVLPGMTGLQQVMGRSDLDYDQWMDYDARYVDEQSLARDAEILVKTIPAVLSGKGAY